MPACATPAPEARSDWICKSPGPVHGEAEAEAGWNPESTMHPPQAPESSGAQSAYTTVAVEVSEDQGPEASACLEDFAAFHNLHLGISDVASHRNPKKKGSSSFRGVTRHSCTGRWEAHLWDAEAHRDRASKDKGGRTRGRQVYLGGWNSERRAACAFDLAAIKFWGASTELNFASELYEEDEAKLEELTRSDLVALLKRNSDGFNRGQCKFRGVTKHHQPGRWEARHGRVKGSYQYLGIFDSEEDAARTYDKVVRRHRGARAVTNFGAAAEPAADPALAQAPTHSPSPLNASAARAALQALPSTCTPSCQSVSSLLPGEAPSSACQGPACRPEAHTEDEVHVLLPCQPLHPAWLDTPSPPGGQVCLQPAEYPSPVAGPCSQCDPPPNLDLVPPSWGRINPELLPSPGDACIAPALVCCTEPSSPGALMPPTPLTLLLHDHQELQALCNSGDQYGPGGAPGHFFDVCASLMAV